MTGGSNTVSTRSATNGRWQRLPVVVRSTIGSLVAAGLGQGALVVSGVLAARALGPENRGHLALLTLFPMVVSQLGLFGVSNAITYYIARDTRSTNAVMKAAVAPALVQMVLCSAFNAILIWYLVRDESRSVQVAGLVALAIPPTFLIRSYGMAMLQGLGAFGAFSTLRVVQPVLYALGLIVLLVVGNDALSVIAGVGLATNVVAMGLTVLAVMRVVSPDLQGTPAPARSEMLRFGAKGFLGTASPLETFRLDQAVVGLFLSPVSLGIYVTSIAFTTLPRLVAQSMSVVAFPHIAKQEDARRSRSTMWRFTWVTVVSTLAVVVPLIAAAPVIVPLMFGDQFRDAVRPLQILLIGSVVFGARRILGECMRGLGYPTANTVAEIVSWVFLLPALALLAPRWGLEGVAFAVVGASVTSLATLGFYTLSDRTSGMAELRQPRPSWLNSLRKSSVYRFKGYAKYVLLTSMFLASAVAAGWLVTMFSVSVVLSVGGGLIGIAVVLSGRRQVNRWLRNLPSAAPRLVSQVSIELRPGMMLPRILYYLGAASVILLVVRPTRVMTISDWFFLGSLVCVIAVLLLSGNVSFTGLPNGVVIGIAIFAVGAGVSSLNTTSVIASITVLVRFAYLTLAWFWLGTLVLKTPKHVRTAIVCWTASAAAVGAASVIQLQLGDVIPGTSPVGGRMTGLTQHINDLGGSTAVALVPAIMITSILPSRLGRLGSALVILPLIVAGMVLSGSVGGLGAGAIGILIWVLMGRVSSKAILSGIAVGLVVFLILSLQRQAGAPNPLERFQGSTDIESQYCSLCSRLDNNQAAWEAIEQSPIIGSGLTSVTPTGVEVHNMILGAWFEAGILGALGIIIILSTVIHVGLDAIRRARSEEEWTICLALLTSFLSFVILSMGQPILFQRYGWISAGLLLALWHQQRVGVQSRSRQWMVEGGLPAVPNAIPAHRIPGYVSPLQTGR